MNTTDVLRHPEGAKTPFKFSSKEGWSLCRRIIAANFPYEPHDVQIEAITKLLDCVDVFAILRTGMGKTSIISMYMIVMNSIILDPSLCPDAAPGFKCDPCIIVILPTKYLQHQMVCQLIKKLTSILNYLKAEIMSESGLKTLVINGDTIHNAQIESPPRDIWKDAIENVPQVIFLAPEQLISKGCMQLLNQGEFSSRVCALVLDEAHLLNTWGAGFRKAFQQIGWVRSRLQDVVLLALSATVREADLPNICEFLGLHSGHFHLLKRSNARPDIQILFRHLKSGVGGRRFPELDWILSEARRTIIFCRTINLGFRIYEYLCEVGAGNNRDITKHIRLYNALNWSSFNDETRQMLQDSENTVCRIAIGTDTMSVGIDIRNIEDVVVVDEPENIDDLVQKFGRVGRDPSLVRNPRAFLYTHSKTLETAKTIVDANAMASKAANTSSSTMDISMARLHLAPCKPKEIDEQYGNGIDPPCHCSVCSSLAPISDRPCNCSGCLSTSNAPSIQLPLKSTATGPANAVPKGKRITKLMRSHGMKVLEEFRLLVWSSADEKQTNFLPPSVFFPDTEIKLILDNFALINSADNVKSLLKSNRYLDVHHSLLYDKILLLRNDFKKIAANRKEELRRLKEEKTRKTKNTDADAEESSDGDSTTSGTELESEIDFSAEEEADEISTPSTAPQWRVIKPSS